MAEATATKSSENKAPDPVVRGLTQEVQSAPAHSTGILGLNRMVGNRAVSQLVESSISSHAQSDGIIQRKCECGSSCSSCRKDDERVQAKTSLPVSHPGDAFEREADSIADRVMRHFSGADRNSISPARVSSSSPMAARSAESTAGGKGESPSLPRGFMSSQSAGSPLPSTIKDRMQSALGYDFGDVRVHSDSRASGVAQEIHSDAFTYGRDIFFRDGRYKPYSDSGQRLIAHELAHVVQQGGARSSVDVQQAPIARVQRFTAQRHLQRNRCLADLTKTGVKFPCKSPPSKRGIGSRIHKDIQARFAKPPDRLTEVPIPGGSGVCRDGELPFLPSTGRADLVKVSRRGVNVIRVQVAEIKPMNLGGVGLGGLQSHCYAQKINDVGDLCTKIVRGIPAQIKRDEPVGTANSVRPILSLCQRLGATSVTKAAGKTVKASADLTIRGYTYTTTIGGRPRRIRVQSCLPGVVGYTCLDEDKKKKKKRKKKTKTKKKTTRAKRTKAPKVKKPKVKVPFKARRARVKASRAALRKLAKLKRLRKQAVKTFVKASRRALLKVGAKLAAKLALKAIPVIGWVLTAIDVAEAIYNISKYGIGFGGGDGGPGGEGESETGVEGSEAAAEGGAPGGTEAEGSTEGGGEGEGREGGEGEGKEGGEGEGKEDGEGDGSGEGEGKQAAGGEGGTTTEGGETAAETGGEETGDADTEGLEFLTDEETTELEKIAEELPLSPELIEALKNSSPEQQQLIDLLIGRMTQAGQLRPDEAFFMKLLQLSEGLTPDQLAVLQGLAQPVKGESLEQILTNVEKAITAVKKGATAPSGEGKESEGKKPDAPSDGKPKPAQETGKVDSSKGQTTGEGAGKAPKPGEGKKGQKGKGGADKGGTMQTTPIVKATVEAATDTQPGDVIVRGFEIVSGLNMNTEYQSGDEPRPTIRITFEGQRYEVTLPIVIESRTKTDDSVELAAHVKAPPTGNAWKVTGTNLTIPTGATFTYKWTVKKAAR